MLKRLVPVALAAFVMPWGAQAEQVTEFSLDNGMDVVVIEDHRSPVVVHMLWYKVGAADEVPGVSGVAHLLEHLMFKGTDVRAPGEFSQLVEANGGSDNAFTSWDYTGYFQRIAVDRLPLMMEMEADRMRNLVLTEEGTAPEVSVVLEERAQRTDSNPNALFREQQTAAQYLNHPYGRPIIGWRHEVSQLGLEEALEFYDEHYVPNNTILIVAGDVTPDEVRELAEQYYGPLEPNPDLPDRVRVSEPPQLAERRLVYEDPRIAQPYMTRSYLAPERDSGAQEQAAALTVLSDLLGGDPATSYLGQRLQFDQKIALYASAYYSGVSLDDTTFNLTIAPAQGVSLADAEAAIDAAVAAFIEEGVDPEDMARLKRQYKASAIYDLDDAGSTARRYGTALTAGLSVEDVQAWPEILQAVTAEDVIAAANMVFDRKNAVTGWLRAPEGKASQ